MAVGSFNKKVFNVLGYSQARVSGTTGSPTTGTYESGGVNYNYYEFTGSGSITFSQGGLAEILVIGGGGCGGRNDGTQATTHVGGGAGAGGYLETSTAYFSADTFTITVGAGGTVGDRGSGRNGNSSRIGNYYALGGGGGGNGNDVNPSLGGSGGGTNSGASGTDGLGNNGGAIQVNSGGGGGGGAGAVGNNGSSGTGGAGGAGLSSSITGSSVTRGGGGGGGAQTTAGAGGSGGGGAGSVSTTATSGTANTGGGGGGSRNGTAGSGGSGIVIIKVRA
jgi:hypothetical protein